MTATVKPALRLLTDRLCLRPFAIADIDDLYAMDGDARVMRWLGSGLAPRSRVECSAALARMVAAYDEPPGFGLMHASRRDDGTFVGGCGLFHVPGGSEVEIAYRLPYVRWGHGYATEMAAAVLGHALGTLALERVIGLTWPENVASQRVLAGIGMLREGTGTYYGREMIRFAASR